MKSSFEHVADGSEDLQQPVVVGGIPGKSTLTSRIMRIGGGGGAALPAAARGRFEASLGADLGGVKVHTGADSAAAAASMGAQALAVGEDIHFAAGKYQPDDPFGLHLLAHEVAHTRQGAAAPMAKLEVAGPDDAAETEADRAADAMVAGAPATLTVARSAAIHRTPEDKPPAIGEAHVPAHALDAAEKKDLEWARTVAKKASNDYDFALQQLKAYDAAARDSLGAISKTFEEIAKATRAAHKKVNDTLEKYKGLDKLQSEVIGKVLGAALGGAGGVSGVADKIGVVGKLEKINSSVHSSLKSIAKGKRAMASLTIPQAGAVGGDMAGVVDAGKEGYDQAQDLAGKATEKEGGGSGLADPTAQELAFWKSYAEIQGEVVELFGLALGLASAGKPIGKLERAIEDVAGSNKTDPAYPIARMKKDAQTLFDATSTIADGVERVPALVTDMKAVLAQLTGSKPKDQKTLEKEMWIQWISGLDGSDKEQLETSGLKQHLKKEKVWEQIGLDPGAWFSGDEQSVVVCMANAQAKVLAHKGETVSPTNKVITLPFGNAEVLMVKLGDLPELPARITGGPANPIYAQVIGATATHEVDTDVLEGVKGKEAITERLLKRKYVTVLLQGLKQDAVAT